MKIIFPALSVAVVALCCACGPPADQQIRFRNQVMEKKKDDAVRSQTVAVAKRNEALVDTVKNALREDGNTTMWTWLQDQMQAETSGVMFEDWKVSRRKQDLYEVRFVYTVMDEHHKITRKGYSWRVNRLLQTVDPPRVLSFSDQTDAGQAASLETRRERLQNRRFSLE